MGTRTRRAAVAAGTTTAVLLTAVVAADAAVVTPTTPRTGSLTQVGPLADHGFPTWYRDSNGVRLEGCWQDDDPYCAPLPGEIPDPDAPASYPDNFPGEHFYQLAGASVVAGVAGTVDVGLDLEGAWAAEEVVPGDQMVFGRIRIRATTAAPGEYRITHPYGVDAFTVAAGSRGINMTEDVGAAAGVFGAALRGRVGPFLTWDTFTANDPTPGGPGEPPAGYVGDPTVDHRVKGSPYGTNVLRVERKAADGSWQVLGETDLFTVQGRLARNSGVQPTAATYRRLPDGRTVVDVHATSESGQSVAVRAPALGYRRLTLAEDPVELVVGSSTHTGGRYHARFVVAAGTTVTGGADATVVQLQNLGDLPATVATPVRLSDVVTTGGVTYDGQRLVVQASSSDPGAVLTAGDLGVLDGGRLEVDGVGAPPPVVTVTSSEGGSITVPVLSDGPATPVPPPVAVATSAPARPVAGRAVTLDASGSLDALSYDWTTVATPEGGAVELADVVSPSFVPPVAGTYDLELVVTGDGGQRSAPLPVTVQVEAAGAPAVARVGADQTVVRGNRAALDGSASTGAVSYSWRQVPGPSGTPLTAATTVALEGASTARPSFVLPRVTLPMAPGPNASYAAPTPEPLVFELTVTNAEGVPSTATTRVSPAPESVTGVTARYRTRGEWRITGTTDLRAGQRVALVLGSTLDASGRPAATSARGAVIATVTVDALGAFTYTGAGPNPTATRPSATTTVTAVSALGGQAVGPITVTG